MSKKNPFEIITVLVFNGLTIVEILNFETRERFKYIVSGKLAADLLAGYRPYNMGVFMADLKEYHFEIKEK